jgi:hypothetical protein
MAVAKNCILCLSLEPTLLVTNTIRPRLLFPDELGIYQKQEKIDDRHVNCEQCEELCLIFEETKKKNLCTSCGGDNKPVDKCPLFSMSSYAVRICKSCFQTGPVLGGTLPKMS